MRKERWEVQTQVSTSNPVPLSASERTSSAPHLSCQQHTTIPDDRLRAPLSMANAKLCLDGSISSFCALSFASLVQVDGIYPSPRTLLLPSFPGTSNRNTNAPFIYLISKSSTRSVVLVGCLFPPFLVRSSILTSSRSTLAYSAVNSSPIPQNNAPCNLLPRTEPPRLGFQFSVFGFQPESAPPSRAVQSDGTTNSTLAYPAPNVSTISTYNIFRSSFVGIEPLRLDF